ncbi:fungal-specific transcription factor domain-containing protein [Ilyonectria sp. MPI-CAGE-AT-0026]|nr:fungal-specific transcription factor domain-containing protein [Ilyonectria sp. MPI-CAGE-AT-0026]
MAEPKQRPESLPSRRNLPRASHACQRCRVKKAKCDQRQPCVNCIKHSHECTYGLRRRNGRDRNNRVPSSDQEVESTQDCLPSQPSTRDGGDEPPRRSEIPEHTHGSDRLVFAPQSLPVDNADVVGDVNQHTHGTEFYGTSSNFVLLNQFFAYAQQHLPAGHTSSSNCNETSYPSLASGEPSGPSSVQDQNSPWTSDGIVSGPGLPARSPLSIVNLLANNESLEPPSRPKTPPHVAENQKGVPEGSSLAPSRTRNGSHTGLVRDDIPTSNQQNGSNGESGRTPGSSAHPATKERPVPERSLQAAQKRLEREYVRLCMSNLHHIHPMLDPIAFAARCEDEIWDVDTPLERNKDLRHFLALYNIVVAVGALGAAASITRHFERDIKLCMKQCPNSSLLVSSQSLSKKYFRKSRVLLGDVFEVCSLESAQTLHLMSIYCQNALKPHACYLYCGHAVRTALAIGIARESMSNSIEDRKAARRTWWCIYSHEIEMSCSAGRRDSLGKPRNYQIDLPRIRAQTSSVPDGSELENCSVAMINEMVHFAAILRRISKQLYYDSKGLTLLQRSAVARELDTLLDDWKVQLPEYLDFGRVSFREEEWAAKQKLVLHLRYLHAKIVLHRPFLEAPMSGTNAQMSRHVESCLEAARDTIRVMHDAYTNRHYFRTWWYNSTYTLYAGMVILYIVILGQVAVSGNELLDDVIKAQDILQSMEEAIVARRSANLIREGLEVARACVQNQQNQSARPEGTDPEQEHEASPGQSDLNNMTSQAGSDFSRTLFSHAVPGQDPALLASIIDPNLLQDFTAADKDMSGLEFPMFPFEGYGLDVDPTWMVL